MKFFTASYAKLILLNINKCNNKKNIITSSYCSCLNNINRSLSTKINQTEYANLKKERKIETKTISEAEINKFSQLANTWWDPDGEFKPLHSMNKLRVELIRDGLIENGKTLPEHENGSKILKQLRILDAGCGGGILCEALARLGADVTGIDASEETINAAKEHALLNKNISKNVEYIHTSIEEHSSSKEGYYDAVVSSDVLEHVVDVPVFVNSMLHCLKPGGLIFLTTLNKTPQSYFGAIVVAERILGLLPNGTHEWENFVPKEDLCNLLLKNQCIVEKVKGMFYMPFKDEWYWINDTSINYAISAIKSC